MAKTDTFFIRASVSGDGSSFAQTSIDLGSYVDALGKSILMIRGVQVRVRGANATSIPNPGNDEADTLFYQLTTQSKGAIVDMTDKSLIASGSYTVGRTGTQVTLIEDTLDHGPTEYAEGYLVGVEQIYLGMKADNQFASSNTVAVMLECQVETLSQSAAMALALSQQ